MRVTVLVVTAVLMIAGVAEAGLSKAAQEWRKGPEKFLMTDEEEKAWKGVTSDAEAAAFIDLFWARRDPTADTPRNEFREEFLSRVQFADASFIEKRKRGALTERGQAIIVLGPPESGTRENMSMAGHSGMSSASARSADSVVFTWSRELAVELGVPRITATFNQVVGSDMYTRDTKFGQFSNVSGKVIQKNIVHPEMTSAPEWAARVGEEVLSGAPIPAAPRGGAAAAGRIGRVVLLDDLSALDVDSSRDPFASLQTKTEFATDGGLAFVVEYCGAPVTVKVEAKINNLAAASQLEPIPMRGVKGCGAIPSMLSLAGLKRGSYELEITIIEPNGSRLTTKPRFEIK